MNRKQRPLPPIPYKGNMRSLKKWSKRRGCSWKETWAYVWSKHNERKQWGGDIYYGGSKRLCEVLLEEQVKQHARQTPLVTCRLIVLDSLDEVIVGCIWPFGAGKKNE